MEHVKQKFVKAEEVREGRSRNGNHSNVGGVNVCMGKSSSLYSYRTLSMSRKCNGCLSLQATRNRGC